MADPTNPALNQGLKGPELWCQEVNSRCTELLEVVYKDENAFCVSFDPNYPYYINLAKQVSDPCNSFNICQSTLKMCQLSHPILPYPTNEDERGESGRYHSVPAFYEITDDVITSLPSPQSNGYQLNVLYPCSGSHIAPMELGFQILERTQYRSVNYTYTEIDPSYYTEIVSALKDLGKNGVVDGVRDVTQKKGTENNTHKEKVIEFTYKTSLGDKKHCSLKFVLGKESKGNYPPYSRQDDFNKADVVVVFDAEDVDAAQKYLYGSGVRL